MKRNEMKSIAQNMLTLVMLLNNVLYFIYLILFILFFFWFVSVTRKTTNKLFHIERWTNVFLLIFASKFRLLKKEKKKFEFHNKLELKYGKPTEKKIKLVCAPLSLIFIAKLVARSVFIVLSFSFILLCVVLCSFSYFFLLGRCCVLGYFFFVHPIELLYRKELTTTKPENPKNEKLKSRRKDIFKREREREKRTSTRYIVIYGVINGWRKDED